jgi:bifunctional non-homologous end joining protein LigD
MTKSRRKGRIFVDYLRNGRGATAVGAYSTRARNGAAVSVPLTWDELQTGIRANHFTIDNLRQRLSHRQHDAWAGFFDVKQKLPR